MRMLAQLLLAACPRAFSGSDSQKKQQAQKERHMQDSVLMCCCAADSTQPPLTWPHADVALLTIAICRGSRHMAARVQAHMGTHTRHAGI